MEKSDSKELWGVEFHIVPHGLDEEEVVPFVDRLLEQVRKSKEEQDRQASLQRLAEQTVVEADKLAESIKMQASQEAQEETAKIISASEQLAREQAERLIKRTEREASAKSSETLANAKKEAEEIVATAHREAVDVLKAARDKVSSIESETKLEAEYIVRRFTVKFVEELRSAVTDTANNMLPSLDHLMKETGHEGVLQEGSNAQPAIASSEGKQKSSK